MTHISYALMMRNKGQLLCTDKNKLPKQCDPGVVNVKSSKIDITSPLPIGIVIDYRGNIVTISEHIISISSGSTGKLLNKIELEIAGINKIAIDKQENIVVPYDDKILLIHPVTGLIIKTIGEGILINATDVAINSDGNIVVTDERAVHIFNINNDEIRMFEIDQLYGPIGVTVDSNGNIIVLDRELTVYDSTGNVITRVGLDIITDRPYSITVNSKGYIIVGDDKTIYIFYDDYKLMTKLDLDTEMPIDVCVDGKDKIIVATNHIEIFEWHDIVGLSKLTKPAERTGGYYNLYNYIINPETNRKVSIKTNLGKQILNKYLVS